MMLIQDSGALLPALAASQPYLEKPLWLILAIAGPAIIALLLVRRARDRTRRLRRFGNPETVARLLPAGGPPPTARRVFLLGGAVLGAGIAMAGPRWGTERTALRSSGADVAIAIDASLSMLAPDAPPNRLERAKQDVRRLRALAPGDRTALIAFAGRSYILTPLTIDDGAIALFLDDLDPSVVGQPGTSLSRAIRQGTDLLLATPTAADRALIIMSDGEGFDGEADVRAAAAHAGEEGISLITVGYGTERGSTIPLQSGGATTVKRDATGEVVVTHYMPDLLAAAAEAAHGTFIPATTTDKAANIRRALNTLRVAQRAVEQGEERSARFQIFLGIALVLLIIDTLLADSRRPVRRARPSAAPGTARTPVLAGARAGAIGAVILVTPGLGLGTAPSHARGRSPMLPAFAAAMQNQGASGPTPASQAAAMRRAIGAGDRSPRTLYNYGTALLASDSADAAVAALSRVTDARDPDVRYRAWFNLGLAHLRRGLASAADSGASELDAALDAYKRILLDRPTDADARWNYELALRQKKGGGGGGGGGAGGGGGSSDAQSKTPPPPRPNGGAGALGRRQAEELLNSAAREERDVEGKALRQTPPDVPPGDKDW
jgi:Ca-activated chloride channel family protein